MNSDGIQARKMGKERVDRDIGKLRRIFAREAAWAPELRERAEEMAEVESAAMQ